VLRLNHGFPEHDMYTLFVDGKPAVDITSSPGHSSALVRSIASLRPYHPAADEPTLDADTATTVVRTVSPLATADQSLTKDSPPAHHPWHRHVGGQAVSVLAAVSFKDCSTSRLAAFNAPTRARGQRCAPSPILRCEIPPRSGEERLGRGVLVG
jgi:hypothetical protein